MIFEQQWLMPITANVYSANVWRVCVALQLIRRWNLMQDFYDLRLCPTNRCSFLSSTA